MPASPCTAVHLCTDETQNPWSRLGDPGTCDRVDFGPFMQVEALSLTLLTTGFESRWGYCVDQQQHPD